MLLNPMITNAGPASGDPVKNFLEVQNVMNTYIRFLVALPEGSHLKDVFALDNPNVTSCISDRPPCRCGRGI
jgi:hypothetical protein